MAKLVDQLCAACNANFYKSPPGQSLLLFIVTLLDGSPVIDAQLRRDPSPATLDQVQSILETLVQGAKMPESLLVIGLIRAIEDVLEDCSHQAPAGTSGWSTSTQRLLRHGVLMDSDGELVVVGERQAPALDRAKQVRADLEQWQELTELILEEGNLEEAIREEMEQE